MYIKRHTYIEVNFNPRTREGCDQFDLTLTKQAWPISIHAPVKGATLLFSHVSKF